MTDRRRGKPRLEAGPMPDGVVTTVLSMRSHDGVRVPGVLYHVPGSRIVATIMHPRLDLTRHYLTSLLTSAGISVMAQGARSVGNDLSLIHEEAVLDAGAGMARMREMGFDTVIAVGASGGATLYAFYVQQAALAPAQRLSVTPAGDPIPLAEADLPVPDGVAFVAAHPGQGVLLEGCIDPSVADESDIRSVIAELDAFDPANGYAPAPKSSTYSPEFIAEYTAAQRARVARIDARALELVAEKAEAKARYGETKDPLARRISELGEIITVYRTDADLRTLDLSIDPSDRPYGSVQGSRPDIGNYSIRGFGRLSTAEAWLSTWSGPYSNANFVKCAPGVTIPSLYVDYSGDQANFPSVADAMYDALASTDKRRERVVGVHFGGSIWADEPAGGVGASAAIVGWLTDRFEL